MARIKTPAEIGKKWRRVVATRQQDYDEGVKDPGVEWAENAGAASESYSAGVQEAIGRGAFAKGVQKAGNDKWRRKTTEVGTQRWVGGVNASEQDFVEGFSPFADVIEQTRRALPPRRPRGDPGNAERSNMMAQALAKKRKEG